MRKSNVSPFSSNPLPAETNTSVVFSPFFEQTPAFVPDPILKHYKCSDDIPESLYKWPEETTKEQEALYKKHNWPLEILRKDPKTARLFADNTIFAGITFYGHQHQMDPNLGLMLPCEDTEAIEKILFSAMSEEQKLAELSKVKMHYKPWSELADEITVIGTAGWLLFETAFYGPYGLVYKSQRRAPSKLAKLFPSYHYSFTAQCEGSSSQPVEQKHPNYCYVDLVTSSKSQAWPGFEIVGGPHGHAHVEFGDDLGNVYSIGQYAHPYRGGDRLQLLFGTVPAVFLSPDPYFTMYGEKCVHRYYIGEKEEGRKNLSKIIHMLESFNRVGNFHNAAKFNCCDLVKFVEDYIKKHFKQTKLMDMQKEAQTGYIASRKLKYSAEPSAKVLLRHYITLILLSVLMTILYWLPFVGSRLGRGKGVDMYHEEDSKKLKVASNIHALKRRNKKMLVANLPVSIRVRQSTKLARNSAVFEC